ncbi:class C sortase [Microbacterium resistens]|uniref:class C sortase n=1 Tax=Microbacterium resistens TaxID=156977 RepID=UPI001C58FDA1|nr:class C sortase [Microbacterium resistens]MBW1640152.1 class C sortase [Microbacterium resistens]
MPTARARRFSAINLLILLGGLAATGLLLYPTAADWFSDLQHAQANAQYTQHLAAAPDETRASLLAEADAYNAALPTGRVRDPYSTASTAPGLDPAEYFRQLDVGAAGVVARVRYERLGVDLPVSLGTDQDVLRKGVGHLFGSSLPVGGAGTHSVLTAHSGAPYAALFDPIHAARVGDIITVDVAGRHLQYRVTGTQTVRPDDTRSLRVEDGQDLLTLLTCTPIGVGSHRLLVHAERIVAAEPTRTSSGTVPAGSEPRPWETLIGAWWIPAFLAAGAILWALVPPLLWRRPRTGDGPASAAGP